MGHSCGYKMRGAYSLVTVNMSIDFISSAQVGQWLTVETDVIKTGSTLCFAQSFIKSDDAVIARANATFRVVNKKDGLSFRGAHSANPEPRDSGFDASHRPGMTITRRNASG